MYSDYLNTGLNPGQIFGDAAPLPGGETPFKPEYERVLQQYPGRGTLKIQLSVAKEAFPIKGVVVDVAQIVNGIRYTLYNDVTDISGIVDNIVLPAKSIESTLNAETAGVDEPVYLVSLYHPDFETLTDCAVKIQDKIETILPIAMNPMNPSMREPK